MSFNGSGTYTLPGTPLVSGEVISSTENNTFRNDIATALNLTFLRNGTSLPTANLPMGGYKLTGLPAGSSAGDSVRYEQVSSDVNITGGVISGITSLGTDGNITINSGGLIFPDGTSQGTASVDSKTFTLITSTGNWTSSGGIARVYAFGAGGDGVTATHPNPRAGGGGGGCAYGDISLEDGDELEVNITNGVATVVLNGTTLLTANSGADGSGATGGTGGTATKHASVTNGGAYTGGSGGNGYANGYAGGGGGSAASPLGNGYAGGAVSNTYWGGGGGGGAGGVGQAGSNDSGGGGGGTGEAGSGNQGGGSTSTGRARSKFAEFTDPILKHCNGIRSVVYGNGGNPLAVAHGQNGSGGGGSPSQGSLSTITIGGNGGDFGGGGSGYKNYNAGNGGFGGGGGGGGWWDGAGGDVSVAGNGGYGGGGGGGKTGGTGGAAIVVIYA